MREIETSYKTPRRLMASKICRSAIKAENENIFNRRSMYDIRFDRECIDYFPYWAGRIETSKVRPLLPAKRLDFFVICNAVSGKYLVLRAMPKMKTIQVDESHIVEDFMTQSEFEEVIMPESVGKHINRQFIFGEATTVEMKESKLIYIPVLEVKIARKGKHEYETHFLNMFSGSVEGE